ncbi:MFS transporter [Amycolatopsis aidingensis]|uniref:MFS transporter n=1 Tax=Amycolatopsis aidingensis TaxID=2842453 RepID=UPI001C0DABC3|nr:MFS transporter [Amycolatopsis aidingensis]
MGIPGDREFRALWLASAQSIVGDQLARVALSVLVYQRTGSPVATAATYALTMLPALVSGMLLAGLADRFPRRAVMVGCDLLRAIVVAGMAVPGVPLPVVAGLLVVAQLAEAPFAAAQGATLPLVLPGEAYERGQRLMLVTHQAGLLAGFAGGGVLVGLLGTHLSLAANAATFLISAVLVRLAVRARPTAAEDTGDPPVGLRAQVTGGAHLIWSDRRLRVLVGLGWLAGFSVTPEGLAAPFADEAGAGAAAVGWLLAADPAGMMLGAFLLGRLSTRWRLRLLGVLTVGTSLPLVAYLSSPPLAVALVLLAASGLCSAYQITAGATFVRLVPDTRRGQALGLARSGMVAAQGLGVTAGGLLAGWLGSASAAIACAGAAGTLVALAAATAWSRIGADRMATTLATHTRHR